MRRRAIISASLPAACLVGAGWYLRYRSPLAYVTFFLLTALVLLTARRLARGLFPSSDGPGRFVRTSVLAFGLVVLSGLVLGAEGLLATPWYLIFLAAAMSVVFTWCPSSQEPPHAPIEFPRVAAGALALIAATVVLIAAVGIVRSPLTLYDSLSYHLLFSARWLQDQQISIVPTPFSDPAQAYQPSNGELWFLWLMLPFHGDLVARIGQLPFLALGAVAVFGIVRQLGARPEHAIYAPLFYLLARPIVEQAAGADVDLVSAAMFATSVYLGIAAVRSDADRDWVLWGISAGLFLGTKYLSVIYMPVLAVLLFIGGLTRRRLLLAAPGIAVLGLPWYLRNWIVAGSPIYPASLQIAGLTIARGAYTRAAMAHSVFHATGLKLWLVATAHAFGLPLFVFWLPCALAGSMWMIRTRTWAARYVLFAFAAMLALEWFGLPDNIDSRFLMPAVAIGMVPMAFTFGSSAVLNGGVHVLYLAGAIWAMFGASVTPQLTLPWYMNGWTSFEGILDLRTMWWFAVLVALAALTFLIVRTQALWRTPAAIGLVSAASLVVAIGADRWCGPERCGLLRLSSTFIRPTMLDAWEWVARNTREATFANTGNNVPYPLYGEQLTNRVFYVNIDRHLDWRLHDYARARTRPGATLPSAPLARSSDELMPSRSLTSTDIDASRPRFERLDGSRDAWIQNLKAMGITRLFVSQLSAYEVDYVWHNEAGFPIEDEWARADPRAFTLVFENPQVRIYALSLP